jgi:hypothetical protein
VIHEPTDLPISLAGGHPGGMKFHDYLAARAGDRRLAERISAYILEWDSLADELRHAPTVGEYARRYRLPEPTAFRRAAEFKRLFPSEETPERLLRLLWDGVGPRVGHLLSVRVLPEFEPAAPRK